MKEELENCVDIGFSNQNSEGVKVLGYIKSMKNAIEKLEDTL